MLINYTSNHAIPCESTLVVWSYPWNQIQITGWYYPLAPLLADYSYILVVDFLLVPSPRASAFLLPSARLLLSELFP